LDIKIQNYKTKQAKIKQIRSTIIINDQIFENLKMMKKEWPEIVNMMKNMN